MSRSGATAVLGIALVATAFVVPRLYLDTVTPLLHNTGASAHGSADAAPIFGWWDAHVGWGTLPAVLTGLLAVICGPPLARRLRWSHLLFATWATAAAWTLSLAMVDGWRRGFTNRLTDPNEYLHQVPTISDAPAALRTFARRIPDFQPDSWITHVAGHPPGAVLTFVWLDRLGLGGGAWAGALVVAIGTSAAAGVIVTVRVMQDELTARRAAPFLATAPTAIWVAVSADGYFMAVSVWGIGLLALSIHRAVRCPSSAAIGSGLLMGWSAFLSYGLILTAFTGVAVLLSSSDWAYALRQAATATAATAIIVTAFWLHGFWWLDGYHAVQQRYWQGIAHDRPFAYWGWANLAATVCAVGLGGVAGVGQALDRSALRRRSGLNLLVAASLLAIATADLSMLSKAETERIWLPFTIWLTAAPALLSSRAHRKWLTINIIGALVLNHVIFTNW